jgi:hypothetical protein
MGSVNAPGRGAHALGKEGQHVRIKAVGLGELPGRFREVADLPRIRHDQRESRG